MTQLYSSKLGSPPSTCWHPISLCIAPCLHDWHTSGHQLCLEGSPVSSSWVLAEGELALVREHYSPPWAGNGTNTGVILPHDHGNAQVQGEEEAGRKVHRGFWHHHHHRGHSLGQVPEDSDQEAQETACSAAGCGATHPETWSEAPTPDKSETRPAHTANGTPGPSTPGASTPEPWPPLSSTSQAAPGQYSTQGQPPAVPPTEPHQATTPARAPAPKQAPPNTEPSHQDVIIHLPVHLPGGSARSALPSGAPNQGTAVTAHQVLLGQDPHTPLRLAPGSGDVQLVLVHPAHLGSTSVPSSPQEGSLQEDPGCHGRGSDAGSAEPEILSQGQQVRRDAGQGTPQGAPAHKPRLLGLLSMPAKLGDQQGQGKGSTGWVPQPEIHLLRSVTLLAAQALLGPKLRPQGLDQHGYTLRAVSSCMLWELSEEKARHLVRLHPAIRHVLAAQVLPGLMFWLKGPRAEEGGKGAGARQSLSARSAPVPGLQESPQDQSRHPGGPSRDAESEGGSSHPGPYGPQDLANILSAPGFRAPCSLEPQLRQRLVKQLEEVGVKSETCVRSHDVCTS
jgi:hypothetical protein